jgi:hypothetical protein
MALIGIHGDPKEVNTNVMFTALEREPTLVIDCANGANPHAFYPFVTEEAFHSTYVVEVELIYKLRDVIKQAPKMMRKLGVQSVFVTTFHRLFAYDNDEENQAIYEHTWILLSELATRYTVMVGIHDKQLETARKYCHEIIDARPQIHI